MVESTKKTLPICPTVIGEELDQVTPVSFTEVLEGTFENHSLGLRLADRSEDRNREFEGLVNDLRLAESNDTLILNKKRQGAGVECTIYIRVWRQRSRDWGG